MPVFISFCYVYHLLFFTGMYVYLFLCLIIEEGNTFIKRIHFSSFCAFSSYPDDNLYFCKRTHFWRRRTRTSILESLSSQKILEVKKRMIISGARSRKNGEFDRISQPCFVIFWRVIIAACDQVLSRFNLLPNDQYRFLSHECFVLIVHLSNIHYQMDLFVGFE